jgi:hypothetical protein
MRRKGEIIGKLGRKNIQRVMRGMGWVGEGSGVDTVVRAEADHGAGIAGDMGVCRYLLCQCYENDSR